MKLFFSVRKNWIIPSLLFYYVVISMVFVIWISRYFGYYGFPLSVSYSCLGISFAVVLLASFQTERLFSRWNVSDGVVAFLNIMYLFPACSLFALSNNDFNYFSFVLIYFFLLNVFNEAVQFSGRGITIINKANLFDLSLILLGLGMIAISGVYTGFRISFDLSEVYEYRMQAREYAMPALLQYVFSWTMYLLPIGLMYALARKKMLLSVFLGFCQVLCFSFNGKKSVFFSFILVLLIYYFYEEKDKFKIPYVFCGFSLISLLEVFLRESDAFLAKVFVRRMMYIPANLGYVYYDFFKDNEFDCLRSSILRHLGFVSPYSEPIPRMIGRIYYHAAENNANTGLCGDAFANFGWLGAVIYPLLIVLLVKLMEEYLRNVEYRVRILVVFLLSYMFISGSFFKLLLTNGILVLLVLLMIYPTGNNGNKELSVEDG